MRLLKAIPIIMFVVVNLLVIVAMNFCAYTAYVPPQQHPEVSYWGLMFPIFVAVNAGFVLFWLVFKWKLAVLPLVGMLLCADSIRAYMPLNLPSPPPEGSIKVLSYNVMSFGQSLQPWEENDVLGYVLSSGADIVCMQEGNKAIIDSAMDSILSIYPYSDYQCDGQFHNACCFSKFPILSVKQIGYPAETNFTYAYEILVESDTLLVINSHLESYKLSSEDKDDYKSIIKNYNHPNINHSETKYLNLVEKISHSDSIRGIQVDSVAAFVQRNEGRRMVLCGDFNATPVSYSHHQLTRGLNDAYTRTGNGPGISYHRSGMYFRLDHILTSPNITAYGAKVDTSIKESDHYPLFCFVKWEQK